MERGRETYCFASAIMADDKGQGFVEFYDDLVFGTKGPNALDEHLHREEKRRLISGFDLSPKLSDRLVKHTATTRCSAYLVNTTHRE
jgi:hypothetical protein